jgi:phage-related protein
MAEVFNFPVETKPTGTTTHRVKRSQFGDGYVQKVGIGLNGKATNWNITLDNSQAVVVAAREFLDRHGGYKSFLWTPPSYPQPLLFTCETYVENPHLGDQSRLTATFEQVFAP